MAVNKLTPRYLNKDDDSRLVKSTEMTDALNVRISSDDDGDALVVKNAYGNEEVTLATALPAGTNKVIGSTANEQSGSIYYFIWNSNDNHSIYRYSVGSNQSKLVYRDSVLAFNENGFVKGNVVTSIDGDELLYFNDSVNSPKKINASKAFRAGYPDALTNGTDEEKLLCLTVAKQPPLDPPVYNIVNNPDLGENRIADKVFQFAYRYIYEDGEVSALSPYSSLTTSVAQLRDGFNTQSAKEFYNQVNVFVKNSVADVEKIQLFAREGNEGTFYQVKELTNNENAATATVAFTNSSVGEALSVTDKNKLYDNVPQLADSQEIASGRLMYGGYTEGYPNTDIDVDLISNYKAVDEVYNINASVSTTFDRTVDFDYAGLPNIFSNAAKLYVNFTFGSDDFLIQDNGESYLTIPDTSVVLSDADGASAGTLVADRVNNNGISGSMSGIRVQETIAIPAGSTKAQAISIFESTLNNNNYISLLSPKDGGSSIKGLRVSSTVFTNEKADFRGRINIVSSAGSGRVSFNISSALFYLNRFFAGGVRKDILSSDVISIDFTSGSYSFFMTDPVLSVGGIFASESISQTKAFKSGASHKLGIVYYDDRNRSGGVQELDDVYVNALNDRSSENNLYGPASIVMRISGSAPSWAKRWSPVYGKSNTDLKLMYGINGAFVPFKNNGITSGITNSDAIYLSLNNLFSKASSYTESTSADINYEFKKGDVLRVIYYGSGIKETAEFNIVSYETLNNSDDNPILDSSSENAIETTTGSFLVIKENKEASDFTISKILGNTSGWFNKCVVEIYNKNVVDTDIYYEVGKSYEVVNGVHSDERTATSLNITISERTGTLQNNFFGTSSVKLFKGDVLSVSSTEVTIRNTYTRGGVFYYYGDSRDINPLPLSLYPATVNNPEKVIDLSLGDVYFRLRSLFTSAKQPDQATYREQASQNSIVEYIEDYSVSDFFTSKSSSIGRAIAPIPDAKTVKRSGSITYSEPYLQEGTFNGLSSFNLSLANFKDLAYEHGSIKGLISYNERMYFVQENRSGVLAVNRQVIDTGSGDNLITLSKNVLQSEQYYVGEYGTNNPESIASRDGMVYFADVKRGKVLRIDSQGLSVISDVNMSSYFDNKFGIISNYQPSTVIGGVDKDNDEYIISSDTITEASVAINTDEYVYTAQLDSSGTQVLADTVYNPSAVFTFSSEVRTFNDICDEFQDSLGAIVYLDDLADGGVVYVDSPYQVSNLYGVATNKTYDFFVSINVNMFLPGFVFDNGYCNSDDVGSINPASSVLDAFTVAYGTDSRAWNTRYSYVPESIVSVHNDLFSFKSGKIYKHSEAASRNTFYGGATAESIVEAVSNAAPSAIKTFESISLEGDTPWEATITTTDQTATLAGTLFVDPVTTPNGVWREKEGFYYAYIHGDTTTHGAQISSVTSTSEIFSLGVVASVDGSAVTFSNAINTISFPAGSTATLYKVNAAQNRLDTLGVYPLSVTGQKAITFSGAVSATAGDLLVVVGNSAIEGDQIRDYFAKIKLTKTTSAPIELFAINATFADSKLHN
jgi:hypothetical protein